MKHLLKMSYLLLFVAVFTTACEDELIEEDVTNAVETPGNETAADEECETAFAYFEEGCFIDDGFNRWGWTIGPFNETFKTEFPIYQAAGQCNLENGEEVGYIDITYDFEANFVWIHIYAFEGYGFSETHFYVGNEKYPRKNNGQFTVAPGKYTEIHEDLDGTNFDEYLIENIEGEIYFIVHAVVCEEDEGELPTDS